MNRLNKTEKTAKNKDLLSIPMTKMPQYTVRVNPVLWEEYTRKIRDMVVRNGGDVKTVTDEMILTALVDDVLVDRVKTI